MKTNRRKRLDGLPPCREFCNRLSWNQYKNKLNCKITGFVDEETGQYKVYWGYDLEGYESCLKMTTLSYRCFQDDVEWCSVTINDPLAFDIYFCGDDTDARIKFKKGDHEYTRNLKLRNAWECETI